MCSNVHQYSTFKCVNAKRFSASLFKTSKFTHAIYTNPMFMTYTVDIWLYSACYVLLQNSVAKMWNVPEFKWTIWMVSLLVFGSSLEIKVQSINIKLLLPV